MIEAAYDKLCKEATMHQKRLRLVQYFQKKLKADRALRLSNPSTYLG